tara:strand:+ start:763 stop:1401 length:639 start_codon:yes stop_codon:yes gene_type:complete
MTSNTTDFKTFDVAAQYTIGAEKNFPMLSYKMFILPHSEVDTAGEFYGLYSKVIVDRKKIRDGRHLMKGDSGFDLYLPRDVEIQPGKIEMIDMNVKIALFKNIEEVWGNDTGSGAELMKPWLIPTPYYLYARSSVIKRGIMMVNGVGIIDKGYRGTLKAGFYNTTDEVVKMGFGERIVQVCCPDLCPYFDVELAHKMDDTSRGTGGIGSTGR